MAMVQNFEVIYKVKGKGVAVLN